MKLAPVDTAMKQKGRFRHRIIHTGQHYDYEMSRVFFEDLSLPEPHHHLGIGSGAHGEQTGKALSAIERVLLAERPDFVVVYGDVNSTLAGALAAVKLHIPIGHVEAGFRSFDMTMPEEINRKVADAVSDILFTSHPICDENLLQEGVPAEKIRMTGEIMIDALLANLPRIRKLQTLEQLGLTERQYTLVTLHRPANVDEKEKLEAILAAFARVSQHVTVVFPVHPRTRSRMKRWRLLARSRREIGMKLVEPLSYGNFVRLMLSARCVLTDSGGIQAETSFLGIPCLTLRDNTERPFTIAEGTNRLIGTDPTRIVEEVKKTMAEEMPSRRAIAGFDGKTAGRIVAAIAKFKPRAKDLAD
jgi:UDP-N-acetylglucosamine 2-epimerase (non-hydrolysing)